MAMKPTPDSKRQEKKQREQRARRLRAQKRQKWATAVTPPTHPGTPIDPVKQERHHQADQQHEREARQSATSNPAWGTSPGALGRVKAESQEARLATCYECGFSAGRHAKICDGAAAPQEQMH